MFVIAGFVIGATMGAMTAGRRGGKGLDRAQYAAGFGIAFALIGLFITLIADHMMRG